MTPPVDQLQLLDELTALLVDDGSTRALQALCRRLRTRWDLALVTVYLPVDGENRLQLLAAAGYSIPPEHQMLDLDVPGIIATCTRTREPFYMRDIDTDASGSYLRGATTVRSEYAIPLLAADKLVGVLNVESTRPNRFSGEERQCLDRIGRLITLRLQQLQFNVEASSTHERFLQVLRVIPVVVWVSEAEPPYAATFVSAHARELLGVDARDFTDNPGLWESRIHDDDRDSIYRGWERLFELDVHSREYRFYDGHGRQRWLREVMRLVRNRRGEPVEIVGCCIDLTENKEVELELRRAKEAAEAANVAKSDFLARMSHELRTPLNGVIGMASVLGSRPLDPEARSKVDTIRLSAEVLLSVINDILDFSQIEAGRMVLQDETLAVADCIDHAVQMVQIAAAEKSLTIDTHIADDVPPHVIGDLVRLRQVLINLVHNAVKFTDEGGIEIHVDLPPEDPQKLRFKVRDSGVGIPRDRQAVIFDPFTQKDATVNKTHGGSGLGLAICAHLVSHMGGDLGVESEEGVGSTFYFELPLRRTESPPDDTSAGRETATPKTRQLKLNVLVAEDNPINQMVTRAQLAELGIEPQVVPDGLAVLDVLTRGTFDIILMDCQMPGLDGYETTRQIRRLEGTGRRVPIVGLTAYASQGDREKCLAAGMDEYLTKPVTLPELARILEQLDSATN